VSAGVAPVCFIRGHVTLDGTTAQPASCGRGSPSCPSMMRTALCQMSSRSCPRRVAGWPLSWVVADWAGHTQRRIPHDCHIVRIGCGVGRMGRARASDSDQGFSGGSGAAASEGCVDAGRQGRRGEGSEDDPWHTNGDCEGDALSGTWGFDNCFCPVALYPLVLIRSLVFCAAHAPCLRKLPTPN